MATIGLNFFLEGFGEMVWGANVKRLDVGIPDRSFMVKGVQINQLELTAAITAAVLVTVLAVFFQTTRIGRALRAVADDHEAALSIGIPLKTIWVVVWSVAGLVAIVAGVMWGAKSGVQFSLSLIALKALPVLILGGFSPCPAPSSAGSSSASARRSARSTGARWSAAPSRTGSPTSWPWPSSWSARRASSAKRSSSGCATSDA